VFPYHVFDSTIWDLCLLPERQLAVAAGQSLTLLSSFGSAIARNSDDSARMYAVSCSPGGKQIASGSADHTVRLYDYDKAATLTPLNRSLQR
jgi:WD40 repeat protein